MSRGDWQQKQGKDKGPHALTHLPSRVELIRDFWAQGKIGCPNSPPLATTCQGVRGEQYRIAAPPFTWESGGSTTNHRAHVRLRHVFVWKNTKKCKNCQKQRMRRLTVFWLQWWGKSKAVGVAVSWLESCLQQWQQFFAIYRERLCKERSSISSYIFPLNTINGRDWGSLNVTDPMAEITGGRFEMITQCKDLSSNDTCQNAQLECQKPHVSLITRNAISHHLMLSDSCPVHVCSQKSQVQSCLNHEHLVTATWTSPSMPMSIE